MKTFTECQFLDWLRKQPDSRPVNMGLGVIDKRVGCALCEFAKDHGLSSGLANLSGNINGGFAERRMEVKLKKKSIFQYFRGAVLPDTFGSLKKDLYKKYQKA